MGASRLLARPALPQTIADPKTKKQKLYNDIIQFLSGKWRSDEVATVGTAFVRALVDTLWAIDGLHSVLASRNVMIPSIFHPFTGYNLPQMSKHRKRTIENLSSTQLRICADSLFGCLQGGYWEQSGWRNLKPAVEELARGLSKYANYLCSQVKTMRLVHMSEKPVRQVADNLHICSLPISETVSSKLLSLQSTLQEKELYNYVVLETLIPVRNMNTFNYSRHLVCRFHDLFTW